MIYTTKQMGDAFEMLVAAELTLAGIPALKVPENWPDYDVIAQPSGKAPLRVSVKSRTFKRGSAYVVYHVTDTFDWLAIVILPSGIESQRRMFLVPRAYADARAKHDKPTSKTANERYWRVDEVAKVFAAFEGNFSLNPVGHENAPTVDSAREG